MHTSHTVPHQLTPLANLKPFTATLPFVCSNLLCAMADAEQIAAPAEGATEVFSKDHQSYFTKSAERVNSTLHAAFCKACQAHGESLDDNRTCLWQARDCIRHLARCPHVSAAVRAHFKEEARLLNARLSSKKRSFPEAFTKPEDAQQDQFTDSHQVTSSLDDLGNTETVTGWP